MSDQVAGGIVPARSPVAPERREVTQQASAFGGSGHACAKKPGEIGLGRIRLNCCKEYSVMYPWLKNRWLVQVRGAGEEEVAVPKRYRDRRRVGADIPEEDPECIVGDAVRVVDYAVYDGDDLGRRLLCETGIRQCKRDDSR